MFVVDGSRTFSIVAAEGKHIDFQLDGGSLIRLKNTTVKDSNGNLIGAKPKVTLTNIKATSTTAIIACAYDAKVDATIEIVGGEYTPSQTNSASHGSYGALIHNFLDEAKGEYSKSGTSYVKHWDVKIDSAKVNAGIVYTRVTFLNAE